MSVKVEQYYPQIYNGILEFEKISETENASFDELQTNFEKAKNNLYITTSDEVGIEANEAILKISPNPLIESLSFRRQRLLNRLSSVSPFPIMFLRKKLDETLGVGMYQLNVDYGEYTVYIETVQEEQTWVEEIRVTINKIKPSNMVFVNKPRMFHQLKTNEDIGYATNAHNYRLGTSWVLGLKPFEEIIDKGLIKMPTVPSVQEALLNSMAESVLGLIDNIKINDGELTIDTFTTDTISAGVTELAYTVSSSSEITVITKIEICDVFNNVLTSSTVYIPMLDDTLMKHTFRIIEGV